MGTPLLTVKATGVKNEQENTEEKKGQRDT